MLKPGSKQNLTASKLQSFEVGKQKKTRFQKEKEAAEAKKKAAEAEAASLFQEFAASFEGDSGGGGGKSFLKTGGSIYAPQSKPMSEMERVALEIQSGGTPRGPGGDDSRGGGPALPGGAGGAASAAAAKKRREMDAFLEEIKQRQENPGAAPVGGGGGDFGRASIEDGDPTSTNLYIGFLAPTVTEERLNEIFSAFGEIYSIKIMWPRTDEERARRRNCGFVSFWRRGDAEAAREAMQGKDVEGMSIQIGWGKPISKLERSIGEETKVSDLPPQTLDARDGAAAKPNDPNAITVLGPPPSASPPTLPALLASAGLPASANSAARAVAEAAVAAVNASMAPRAVEPAAAAAAAAAARGAEPLAEREMQEGDQKVVVVLPRDEGRRYLIDRTARYVAKDGAALEDRLIQRESSNPDFDFLTNYTSEEGTYYRWRAYAFAMGDRERRWRQRPFQMVVGGAFWIPPAEPEDEPDSEEERELEKKRERERRRERMEKEREEAAKDPGKAQAERYKYMTGRQLEKAREAERERGGPVGRMPQPEEDNFRELLGRLTMPSRRLIREAMGAALDNSECSAHVVEILSESLMEAGRIISEDGPAPPPPPVIVARLYLVSDVLHNSAAPVRNATSFRTLLQSCLPQVFEALGTALRGIAGRLTARQLRERVLALLAVWSDWSIYPPLFLTGLEASLMRAPADMAAVEGATAAGDVREEDMDRAALERKARQAGLHVSDAMSALDLFNRLNHLNAYVKAKAAGRALGAEPSAAGDNNSGSDSDVDGVPLAEAPAAAQPAAAAAAAAAESSSDDEDIDGVPLALPPPPRPPLPAPPPPPPAAAAAAAAKGKGEKRAHSKSASSDGSDADRPAAEPDLGGLKKSRWD
ncbi:hypothetical protein JKP88DRAFT_270519 [Tribonema minus]|uniref:Uncharacterized protein n=1 Tax=Tribonema minus TaxID=303371 RepID=A0A836CAC0_9STRA|nr:hypothetical protein JKP88DRAFT_270519 [Tribonema minus]